MDKILQIVADEIGIDPTELVDECKLSEFGIDDCLAGSISNRVRRELEIELPAIALHPSASINNLRTYLKDAGLGRARQSAADMAKNPLSLVMQNSPDTCKRILFLVPDGSGTGMAYVRLPPVDDNICVIALNSPYLGTSATASFTVESIAEIWAAEIQRHQDHGPYLIGGWSAGGYCSYEIANQLIRKGEKVEKLVLIDSPCRLKYDALPMAVLEYLSTENIIGAWEYAALPEWLINHCRLSVLAVHKYKPTPLNKGDVPSVSIIWAEDSVLEQGDPRLANFDLTVNVTHMLIERPPIDGVDGWDMLLPGARMNVAKLAGNHFTIVYPPNVSLDFLLRSERQRLTSELQAQPLSELLRDAALNREEERGGTWSMMKS